MSFRAELIIEDKTYRVLYCSHTLSRNVHENGRPSSRTRFGRIDLEIESTDDIDFWINCQAMYQPINGKIVFKKRDEEVKLKELQFENGFVIEHTETFIAQGESPMTIQFSITASTFTLETSSNAVTIENSWSGE